MNPRGLFLACVSCISMSLANADEERRVAVIDLSGSALLATEASRSVLDYVVQCALPDGTTAEAKYLDQEFQFRGAMGIAPDWRARALTNEEQAAVSACLLARTNAFGVPVQISLRSGEGPLAQLSSFATSEAERRTFPVFEGAFFGNVFLRTPHAYTCRGDTSGSTERVLRRFKRICTLPTEQRTPEGRPVSACGFIVLGRCDDPDVKRIKADYANAVAEVYLPIE